MKATASVFTILMLGVVAAAFADYGVDLIAPQDPIDPPPPLPDFIEGWNDNEPYSPPGTYAANTFGFAYMPSVDYTLERVEFFADGAGAVSVEIMDDAGSGCPTGNVLGSVAYNEVAGPSWQGADLVPPVAVSAGTTYYISYHVVVGAPLSAAATGTIIPHCWSYDGGSSWSGPSGSFYWMARFYGTTGGTPVEETSWSSIKSLY